MIKVTSLLLASSVSASSNLRKLADDWLPSECAGWTCSKQDDGYWIEMNGEWEHKQYAREEMDGRNDAYRQQDKSGEWTEVLFEKRLGDGGYFINDMYGEWRFNPFEKEQDESGYGYWIENFEGEPTYVEYETERMEVDGQLGTNIL